MVKCKKCGDISADIGVQELIKQTVKARVFDKDFSFEDIDIIDTQYIDTELFYCFNCMAETKEPGELFEYIDEELIIKKYKEKCFVYDDKNFYIVIDKNGKYHTMMSTMKCIPGIKYYLEYDAINLINELNKYDWR